ncbi:MAG: hypothetical protein LC745_06770 [Planctomycetia bacterium]|nr:hypothetical protein [Planctomycetia bacterium]
MSGVLNIRYARTFVARVAVYLLLLAFANSGRALAAEPPPPPLHRTVDLDRGEPFQIEISDGSKATVKLLDVEATRDTRRLAIREARVRLEIDGLPTTLLAAMDHLPRTIEGCRSTVRSPRASIG